MVDAFSRPGDRPDHLASSFCWLAAMALRRATLLGYLMPGRAITRSSKRAFCIVIAVGGGQVSGWPVDGQTATTSPACSAAGRYSPPSKAWAKWATSRPITIVAVYATHFPRPRGGSAGGVPGGVPIGRCLPAADSATVPSQMRHRADGTPSARNRRYSATGISAVGVMSDSARINTVFAIQPATRSTAGGGTVCARPANNGMRTGLAGISYLVFIQPLHGMQMARVTTAGGLCPTYGWPRCHPVNCAWACAAAWSRTQLGSASSLDSRPVEPHSRHPRSRSRCRGVVTVRRYVARCRADWAGRRHQPGLRARRWLRRDLTMLEIPVVALAELSAPVTAQRIGARKTTGSTHGRWPFHPSPGLLERRGHHGKGRTVSFGFRIRFKFSTAARLPLTEPRWVLHHASDISIFMVSLDEAQPIAEATDAALFGSGYATPDDAGDAGNHWRSILVVALARLNVGVDFLERSPALEGRATQYGLELLAQEHGRPVVNDRPGVLVYEEPRPLFAAFEANAEVKPSMRRASATFEAAAALPELEVTDAERLAFDLYGASFFESNTDARLLMVMMAVEALIDQQPRTHASRELVRDLMRQVRESDLEEGETNSIIGAMKWLEYESIGQAGRHAVGVLGNRRYMGLSASKFFTRCYELRSALVHGHQKRPAGSEVDVAASNLQLMVGEILGRRLLHVTEEWAVAQEDAGSASRQ